MAPIYRGQSPTRPDRSGEAWRDGVISGPLQILAISSFDRVDRFIALST